MPLTTRAIAHGPDAGGYISLTPGRLRRDFISEPVLMAPPFSLSRDQIHLLRRVVNAVRDRRYATYKVVRHAIPNPADPPYTASLHPRKRKSKVRYSKERVPQEWLLFDLPGVRTSEGPNLARLEEFLRAARAAYAFQEVER